MRLGRVRLAQLGTTTITDADSNLATNAQAAVLEFWSPMCAPCLQYKPVFDEAASKVPQSIMMASVNVEEAPALAARYELQATPTTLFLSGGTEVNRVEGKMTQEELLAAVESAFGVQTTPPAAPPAETPSQTSTTAARQPHPTQKDVQVQPSSGPSARGIVAGVAGIALALAGLALILSGKD